jgi:hypothetical protein
MIWWRVVRFDVLRLGVGKEVFEFSPGGTGLSRADRALRFLREARYQREPVPLSEHVVYYPWYNYICKRAQLVSRPKPHPAPHPPTAPKAVN